MKRYNLFISTPIAGFEDEQEYLTFRDVILRLIEQMKQCDNVGKIYCALADVSDIDTYDSPADSAVKDLNALQDSTHFILFYPYRVISSALIELGYALADNKKILIIVSQKKDLPYMAQGLGEVQRFQTTILENEIDQLCMEDIVSFLAE